MSPSVTHETVWLPDSLRVFDFLGPLARALITTMLFTVDFVQAVVLHEHVLLEDRGILAHPGLSCGNAGMR